MESSTPNKRTQISAGIALNAALSKALPKTSIYPVVAPDSTKLPYITYRLAGLEKSPVKGTRGSEYAAVELTCYAATVPTAVEMAETVSALLDRQHVAYAPDKQLWAEVTNAEQEFYGDAHGVTLTLRIQI